MFLFNYSITNSNKNYNEDAINMGASWLIIADGASPLTPAKESNLITSRFANSVVSHIAAQSPSPRNIRDCITKGIEQSVMTLGSWGATCTLAVVSWDDNEVAVASIGDSPVVIESDAGCLVLKDPQFEGNERQLISKVNMEFKKSKRISEAYSSIEPVLRDNRSKRNTPRGVWVVSDYTAPNAITEHITTWSFPRHQVESILASTDGFWRVIDIFEILTVQELVKSIKSGDGAVVFRDLIAREKTDPERSQYLRLSYMDDASVAFTRITTL